MDRHISTPSLQEKLYKSLQVIRQYDWLIDAYILDFFVDNHWAKLPSAWEKQLERLQPERLHKLLVFHGAVQADAVLPLSLLALRRLLGDLCISRQQQNVKATSPDTPLQHPKLKHIFTKCVKPKKRHEIQQMAAICKSSCVQTAVDFVVDFGAGLGHLARVLGYGYGIRVCCLEMQSELNMQAQVIDAQLEAAAAKHLPNMTRSACQRPTHVTLRLTADMTPSQFLDNICKALELPSASCVRFGIIGLHPCGDLAVILMRMFFSCTQARFLNFASCCYMKLSTADSTINGSDGINATNYGFPLSSYLRQLPPKFAHLSYEAREISCHAAEIYCDRLAQRDYEHLKVHSFRAAAERILVKHWPELRHCGLRSVKHVPGMQFQDYFYKAVQGLPAEALPSAELQTTVTINDLLHWKRIVIFYTLRLMFAPLVESVILYDRALFLRENHCQVEVNAMFDPRLSPRNHITNAFKNS